MLNQLKNQMNVAYTHNGARAFATTESSLLDFFAQGGAIRNRSDSDKISLFTKAFGEDATLALRTLFYFRDVRGGQGERNTFRVIVKYLADRHTDSMRKNLHLIPFFGRWDDMYAFVGTKLEADAFEIMRTQFKEDIKAEYPSLLGKWLKSENASSFETKQLGKKTREVFGLTPKAYRKTLTDLRKKISIVESKMSAKKWVDIDYSKVPSQAGMRYRQAFYRNDEERYEAFVNAVKRGDEGVKMNTKTLYPYEIIREVENKFGAWNHYARTDYVNNIEADVLDTLWNNLPDYFEGKEDNSLVVVDTSGSMSGLPIQIAVSLGIYAAERNKGKFHNHFMTFSERPELVELKGTGLVERVHNMTKANWDMDTNIERVFSVILDTAIKNNVPQDEMISRVLIVSDMQFNRCVDGGDDLSLFEEIEKKYKEAGYSLPKLVFWNVNASSTQFPSTISRTGAQLVSGASPSIFKNVMKGDMMSPYELMLDVINDERYSQIEA